MARAPRIDLGGYVYHVINRANGRAQIFQNDEDYRDFEYLLNEIRETYDMRILAYVIMPNHWHLLLHPKKDGDLRRALHWLSTSHVRRHHTRKGTIGQGHLYQGTYKSFLVQTDMHLLTVLKYIERNAVRAKLCKVAQAWKWCSAYRRCRSDARPGVLLAEPPVPLPRDYRQWINDPEPAELLKSIRSCVNAEVAYGEVVTANIITQHKNPF